MSLNYYILVNYKPVLCTDTTAWTDWLHANRVNIHLIKSERNNILVSTVFLAMGLSPIVNETIHFETLVFDKDHKVLDSLKYITWEQAKVGHLKLCKKHLKCYTKSDIFIDVL